MGFFSNLIKGEAKKFVSDMVDKVVDEFDGNSSKSYNNGINKQTSGNNSVKSNTPEGILRNRLENIIANAFPGYELKKNVSASEMGAGFGAEAYSYGIYYNDTPRLYISVISNRNDYKLKRYRMSKQAAENNGVTHFNFFSHLPNEESYITNRLSEVL